MKSLPNEIFIEVMKELPEIAALSRLFTAYPEAMIPFEPISAEIFAIIVKKMSPEIRNAALDVLTVRSREPIPPCQTTHFIEHYLTAVQCYTPRSYSHSQILDLIEISESIEGLTESFARYRVLGPCVQPSMPLSPIELHRIQRSFWRFQLCYDLCHPEGANSAPQVYDIEPRSTRRYVQYHVPQPASGHVPNWLQCRGETFRPEALSRFLPNLSRWEQDELEATRFHLAHQVNRIQYHRSCGLPDPLARRRPVLLQRLVRDIDHWDTQSPTDHLLVADFRQRQHLDKYPIVWDRRRDLYAASSANTRRTGLMELLQNDHRQWGWCMWDEQRLVRRGLIDPGYEALVDELVQGDESQRARVYERRAAIDWAHEQCARSQYSGLERRMAVQYEIDARSHLDRMQQGTVQESGPEDGEAIPVPRSEGFESRSGPAPISIRHETQASTLLLLT